MSTPPIVPGPVDPQPSQPAPAEPTVTVAPGGLSTGAHAVHIVASVFTLGLWLPVYGAHAVLAPKQRVSITGTPEQIRAHLAATQAVARPIRYNLAEKILIIGGFPALILAGLIISVIVRR